MKPVFWEGWSVQSYVQFVGRCSLVLSLMVLCGMVHHHEQEKMSEQKGGNPASGINPDVLARLLKDNPGLKADFLEKAPPDQEILLSNGKKYPLYRLTQFLEHNFKLEMHAAEKQGEALIEEQNWKMHRLMAHPKFYEWFKSFGKTYKVHNKKVDWETAYRFVRDLHNDVKVAVDPKAHMPYGGGGRAVAPSWAVWKKMNLLYHEVANATPGFSGDDPVMTGVLAGHLEKMDKQKDWNYSTIDVNTLQETDGTPPNAGADKAVKKKKK
jgi:hypothetical protein